VSVLDLLQPAPPRPTEDTEIAKQVHERVVRSFKELPRAWSNRDADSLDGLVSTDYLARARAVIDGQDREFQVTRVEDDDLNEVAVERPPNGAQTVNAYLSFVGRNWLEDLRTGEILSGSEDTMRGFVQRWTFVFEGRKGWVVHRVRSVWTGPADRQEPRGWPGLPKGWYSRSRRPGAWRRWNGEKWKKPRDPSRVPPPSSAST
jgi:hypothetical protein